MKLINNILLIKKAHMACCLLYWLTYQTDNPKNRQSVRINCQLSFYMFKLSGQKCKRNTPQRLIWNIEANLPQHILGWTKASFLDVSSTSSKSSLAKEEGNKVYKALFDSECQSHLRQVQSPVMQSQVFISKLLQDFWVSEFWSFKYIEDFLFKDV